MSAEEEFCPYVGLQPFREQDRDYFFGRSRDQRVIVSNLYASNLTVLYGASGVGKSSVLLAGVVPALRESPKTAVAVFRDWAHSRFQDEIKRVCIEAITRVKPDPGILDSSLPLDELLARATEKLKITVLVILDQFEEYFLYHPESEAGNTFDEEFARAVNRSDVDVGFLIALREDGIAKLDRFRSRIPGLLGNTVRLRHLDDESAREAIRLPVEKIYNARYPALATSIEDDLVTALIEEVRGHQLGVTGGAGKVSGSGEQANIETALLQLLLTKLWKAEPRPEEGQRVLRLQTFREMGGAERVVERHLSEIMGALTPEQLELCARIFDRLVTPSGTKVACREKDLVKWAGDLAPQLPEVLRRLSTGESRIVRPVAAAPGDAGGDQYEIFHDVLGGAILGWRTAFLADREQAALRRTAEEQRQRAEEKEKAASRLKRALVRARAFTVVALVAALAAWVFEHRAEKTSELASSRALDMAAINQSRTDPELGELLALHAVAAARNLGEDALREAADALGRSIDASRVRSSKKVDSSNVEIDALSPDGTRLLTLADDGTLQLLKLPDAKESEPLPQSQGVKFRFAVFAPTGNLIGAIAGDNTVRIWNTQTGKPPSTLRPPRKSGRPGKPDTLRFSADASMIAVAGDYTVWVWHIGDDDPFLTLSGHKDQQGRSYTVTALAFHPRLPILATGGWDNTVRLWSLRNGEPSEPAVMKGHRGTVEDLEFSPDGKQLVSTSLDATARIWDVETRKHKVTLYGHSNSVFSASYSRDGKKIVTASADTTARIWDAGSGREVALLASHSEPVSWARFTDEDRSVVTESWDHTVKTWSASGHAKRVRSMLFSPDGLTVATAGDDHDIRLWDVASGDEVRRLTGPQVAVTHLRSSRNGKRLAAGDNSGRVTVWDWSTGGIVAVLCCARSAIEDISFSPDGSKLVVAAGFDGVALWNVDDQAREAQLVDSSELQSSFEKTDFSPDGRWIAAANGNGELLIWPAGNAQKPRTWKAHEDSMFVVKFSPDSRTIMTGGVDHVLNLWDVASGKQRRLPSHDALQTDGTFTPDSARVITCDLKGAILVFDTTTAKPLSGPPAHASECVLALSKNGDVLATFSWDRTVRVWDTRTWRELATFTHREQVDAGAISPDGKHLATRTVYDGVRIVAVDLDELVQLAKSRLTRGLKPEECERHLHQDTCPALP